MAHNVTGNLPELCFGQVRHTRLRPVRHAFSYRVFYLRLPVRSFGNASLRCRLLSRNRFNLLSFHDADHGDGVQPLETWIDGLLRCHGIDDADGEAWLQTFPRVLGYVFNPVSFWFCHRSDGVLRAIVCEVNNTFGERHCYLLDSPDGIRNGQELAARKVFHVSPFCRIEGEYRFRFVHKTGHDAAVQRIACQSIACINYHDADGPLLNTSISGTGKPLNNANAARAFIGYPMMTLGVMAKIHWQALRLWLRRVPFHFKPAPPAAKITR